jgi:mannose-1-phosphate guanylyltransferase
MILCKVYEKDFDIQQSINDKVPFSDDDESQTNFESSKDAFDDDEHLWNLSMFIQTTDMTLHEVITLLEEMGDDVMEAMVKHEVSTQIINLLIKNQADNIVLGELFNFDDLEDWMQCVTTKEERRNEIFLKFQQ